VEAADGDGVTEQHVMVGRIDRITLSLSSSPLVAGTHQAGHSNSIHKDKSYGVFQKYCAAPFA
jgi:hypothetical protein